MRAIKLRKEDTSLILPKHIQNQLDVNKYSQIDFFQTIKGVKLKINNPESLSIEGKSFTILRNDFVCNNSKCNKPIIKNRGKKLYCSYSCYWEHKRSKK